MFKGTLGAEFLGMLATRREGFLYEDQAEAQVMRCVCMYVCVFVCSRVFVCFCIFVFLCVEGMEWCGVCVRGWRGRGRGKTKVENLSHVFPCALALNHEAHAH